MLAELAESIQDKCSQALLWEWDEKSPESEARGGGEREELPTFPLLSFSVFLWLASLADFFSSYPDLEAYNKIRHLHC